jgi:hypothetical protein
MPILLPAPGRLSMIHGWLSFSERSLAVSRDAFEQG